MKSRTNIIIASMAFTILVTGCFIGKEIAFSTKYNRYDSNNTNINTANIIKSEQVAYLSQTEKEKQKTFEVPDGDTSFKSYMDYRAITNIRSDQFKLQQECVTDSHGLRRYGEDYVIAVGSYYSKNIGDRLTIMLDNGDSFTAVVGDFKADDCTDTYHRYYAMSDGRKNVIEFIVDTDALDNKARRMGDISYIDGFSGNVIKIAKSKSN